MLCVLIFCTRNDVLRLYTGGRITIVTVITLPYRYIPKFGTSLQSPFKDYLILKRKELHREPGTEIANVSMGGRLLAYICHGYYPVCLPNSLGGHIGLCSVCPSVCSSVLPSQLCPEHVLYFFALVY